MMHTDHRSTGQTQACLKSSNIRGVLSNIKRVAVLVPFFRSSFMCWDFYDQQLRTEASYISITSNDQSN